MYAYFTVPCDCETLSPNKFILKGHFVLVLFYRHALLLTSSNTRDLFDELSMKIYGRVTKAGGEKK